MIFADIRDRAALAGAFDRAHCVYHLAANPNLWVRDRGEFEAVNHQGTKNVLDLALASRGHPRASYQHREHPHQGRHVGTNR